MQIATSRRVILEKCLYEDGGVKADTVRAEFNNDKAINNFVRISRKPRCYGTVLPILPDGRILLENKINPVSGPSKELFLVNKVSRRSWVLEVSNALGRHLGFISRKIIKVGEFTPLSGRADHRCAIFLAFGDYSEGRTRSTEVGLYRPHEDVLEMLRVGEVNDMATITAIFYYLGTQKIKLQLPDFDRCLANIRDNTALVRRVVKKNIHNDKWIQADLVDVFYDGKTLCENTFICSGKGDGYVAVLPVLPDGSFVFTKQCKIVDGLSTELVAGGREEGESWYDAAARELAEEAKLVAGQMVPLGVFHPVTDMYFNPCHLFLALDCKTTDDQPLGDEVQGIGNFICSREKSLQMIESGKIRDLSTAATLFAVGLSR
ncbi:MAG: NUDIX domain-containing protein [Patescibacteria group bacterium]